MDWIDINQNRDSSNTPVNAVMNFRSRELRSSGLLRKYWYILIEVSGKPIGNNPEEHSSQLLCAPVDGNKATFRLHKMRGIS